MHKMACLIIQFKTFFSISNKFNHRAVKIRKLSEHLSYHVCPKFLYENYVYFCQFIIHCDFMHLRVSVLLL